MRNKKEALILSFILILTVSFFVRFVGLVSFQKGVDGDEADVGIFLLEKVNATGGYINTGDGYSRVGKERGYFHGFSKIYYRPLIKIFTPSIALLKFTTLATGLILLATLMILLRMVYDDFFEKRKKEAPDHDHILFLSWLYIAIPPLLLVIWNLKAKPEFLDTLIIGQILFILTLKLTKDSFPLLLIFLAGVTSGLGFSGQPMMVYYILPAVIFIILRFLPQFKLKKAVQSLLAGLSGGLLGVTPLIIYNAKRGWPILHYLGADIIEGPYDTAVKRVSGFFNEAYPMLTGVRNEWKSYNDLLPEPYDRIVVALVSLLILLAVLFFVWRLIKQRQFQNVGLFVIGLGCFFAIVAQSNFASFLAEPRRVLPFYSLYFPLILYALLSLDRFLKKGHALLKQTPVLVLVLLIAINTFVISKTAYSFDPASGSRFTKSREQAGNTLISLGINRIYTHTWIGDPITFESQGRILWKYFPFSKYPSYAGFNFKPTLENAAIVLYKDESVVSTLKGLGFKSLEIEDLAVFPNLSNYTESYDQILDKVDSL